MSSMLLLSAMLMLSTPSAPEQAAVPKLVTAAWLAEHLGDSDLVLLHVGSTRDYAAHIPGARLITLSDVAISDPNGLTLQMVSDAMLRAKLEVLGISNTSRIVVYPASNAVQSATRVVLTLDYVGLGARTSMLDGGLTAWTAAGRPTTNEPPPERAAASLKLSINPIVVDSAFVLEHLKKPGFAVVDARATALYDGTQTGGSAEKPHKTGHIDGALSVPFSDITNGSSQFKSVDELKALFTAAGVKPGDTVVAYCHIGQQATATIFGARLAGYKAVLYDGSFEEWSRLPNAPVVNPAIKK